VKYHLQIEAKLWEYEGYESTVKLKRHFEVQNHYDNRDDLFPYKVKYYKPQGNI
jgi:hypothetical protein